METFADVIKQEMIEQRYNRKHIDAKIRKEILDSAEMQAKHAECVSALNEWMAQDFYASKNERIAQLKLLDLDELVMEMMVGISYFYGPELYTSATAQLANRLKFSDKADSIKTIAEMVAIMAMVDLCDVTKEDKQASLYVQSRIPLSDQLVEFVLNSEYLPPMVCEPLELTHNYSSGYLTHNDSLVLGSGNHHDGDLCLDVLNLMNRVPLKLNTELVSEFEEQPTFELDTQQKVDNWTEFKKQSYVFYDLMVQNGNRFYLTNKVDKRGRIYAQGYHISTQGTAFKKAAVQLADEEIVTGAPV
ncbi:hypothetical protein [Xenophilus sp. Marseille-Q4582]|uniref:hypothetical protein n=1 Tax=Xenophilus sp. Marseille-Q4582 TaxID=2866600 RepID=UPI001CE4496E|nr:hypothetical protein [Xenophilus sp. Marseille-Q4582]